MQNLSWEYLVYDEDFLFKGRNCLIRVPSEKRFVSLQKIAPPVRLLVVISNPPDLQENMKLDVVREKRLIKDALHPLIDEGKLAVKWEDEASLERIQDALINFKPHVIKDANIRHLLGTLTLNLRGSRVMITSRQDFDFTRDKRCQAHILQIPLRELTKMEVFRLMQNIPSLCNSTDEEKLEIFKKVGGNPFILDLVAARARDVPVGNVLAEIKNVQKEFIEKTMLNNLYEWLPDDETRKFFRKASVYRMPVNQVFLVAVGGSDERIGYLLHKSLLNRITEDLYEMHSNTRAFGFEKLKEIDGSTGLKETQVTAAQMYYDMGVKRKSVDDHIEAHRFYFETGEFDKAGEIVLGFSEPLLRWGHIDLIQELLEKSIDSTSGNLKSNLLHNLGVIHQQQGRYDDAVTKYQESMKIKKELGDREGIATTLGQMGRIFIFQKNYKEALKSSLFAFLIFKELKSPYKDLAGKDIMKLKEEIGEELFNKYYQEITSDEQREKDNN